MSTQTLVKRETWKAVPTMRMWQVNQDGVVRLIDNPSHLATPHYHKDHKRVEVTLWDAYNRTQKSMSVALLVAKLFIGDRPGGWAVDFRDGNRENVKAENLYYRPFQRRTHGESSENGT